MYNQPTVHPIRITRVHCTIFIPVDGYYHYLLPTTYYLLPTTYYLLPTTYYLLPTAYCLLPTTYYLLPTTYYLLPTTYYLLPTDRVGGPGHLLLMGNAVRLFFFGGGEPTNNRESHDTGKFRIRVLLRLTEGQLGNAVRLSKGWARWDANPVMQTTTTITTTHNNKNNDNNSNNDNTDNSTSTEAIKAITIIVNSNRGCHPDSRVLFVI